VAVWVRVVLQFAGWRGGKVLDPPHSEDCRHALGRRAPDQLGQLSSSGHIQRPVLRGVEGSFEQAILIGFLSFFSFGAISGLRLVGQSSPSTHTRPCQRVTTPRDCFTMGSVWCLRTVISYLLLWICLSILSSLFNTHLGFTFCLYADLTRSRPYEEGVQRLRQIVLLSHGRKHLVDTVLRGGYHDPLTTRPSETSTTGWRGRHYCSKCTWRSTPSTGCWGSSASTRSRLYLWCTLLLAPPIGEFSSILNLIPRSKILAVDKYV
jgi:hypothetical protein